MAAKSWFEQFLVQYVYDQIKSHLPEIGGLAVTSLASLISPSDTPSWVYVLYLIGGCLIVLLWKDLRDRNLLLAAMRAGTALTLPGSASKTTGVLSVKCDIQDVDDTIKACACSIRNQTLTAQDIKRYFAISKSGSREVISPLRVVSKAKHENQAQENLRLLAGDSSAFYVVTFSRSQRKAYIHDRAYELPLGEYLITLRFLVDGRAMEAENIIRVTSSLPYIEWGLPDDKIMMRPISDAQEPLR